MTTTTYDFTERVPSLPHEFTGKHAVVVFEKAQGHYRRVTGKLEVGVGGAKLTVYRPDGKYRTIPAQYVVRIVVLDYRPPA